MKSLKKFALSLSFLTIGTCMAMAQGAQQSTNQQTTTAMEPQILNTYVIERELEGAGNLTNEDLKNISKVSCTVLSEMDQNDIQWMHSYVTEDKIFCVYRAKNKELIKKHAEAGKFPCNSINLLSEQISPATAK